MLGLERERSKAKSQMRLRGEKRQEQPRHHAADGDFIGNDEMLKINEGRRNQAGDQNALGQDQRDGVKPEGEPAERENRAGQDSTRK